MDCLRLLDNTLSTEYVVCLRMSCEDELRMLNRYGFVVADYKALIQHPIEEA